MKHNCSAPICAKDTAKGFRKDVIWYAGEEVCPSTPKERFQKVQLKINKNQAEYKDVPFTASELAIKRPS